jgi:hypothetical protein
MKLVGVKVGQILKDKFGNKYEVVQIDEDDNFMPVKLKCIKFVKDVCFGLRGDIIAKVGHYSWVLKDYSRILSSDSTVGEFLKRNFCSDTCANELKRINLSFNGIERDFVFGSAENIKKIEVTLKDLLIDDNENYLTKDNVRLDDIIVDKNGVEYTVISIDSNCIGVKYKTKFIGIDGTVFDTYSTMYIPFHYDIYEKSILATKEFVFKNK